MAAHVPRGTPDTRRSGRRSAGVIFIIGLAVAIAGIAAFSYAHEHGPDADPMAVHVISRAAYEHLHRGGIAAMAAGAFGMLAGLVVLLYHAEPS